MSSMSELAQDQELRSAVQRTLAYARVFGGTLTESQLRCWLLSGRRWTAARWQRVVPSLRQTALWRDAIQNDAKYSQFPFVLGQEELSAVQALSWIPWIQSLWLTGRRAATGEAVGDIDLLFIVDEHRLWLTRLLVIATGLVHGKYRTRGHGSDEHLLQGRWCCNAWLTPSQLSSFVEHPNFYHAREVVQAVPLGIRFGSSDPRLFWRQNRWVRAWVAEGWEQAQQTVNQALPLRSSWSWWRSAEFSLWWDGLEWLAWQLQFGYLRRHRTREVVDRSRALFHPRDTQGWVQQRYATIAREYGLAERLDE